MSSGTSISDGQSTQGDRVEAMARELAQLRVKVETLEARSRPRARRRGLAKPAVVSADASARPIGTQSSAADRYSLSRRRLFGLLGGAAAAGAGLTVAGSIAGPSSAGADGPDVLLANGTGGTGNNAGTVATSITSSATSATFQSINAASPQLSLSGATASGPPSGLHNAGDLFVDSNGIIWYATATGNPATWVPLSLPPIFAPATPAPVRIYDSRPPFPPANVQKGQLQTNEERTIDLTNSGALNLSGSYAALLNLTIANTIGAGFVAIFAANTTWPGHSNIDWFQSNQILANNATSLFDSAFRIKAHNGGPPTDLVIDVMGAYLG
jgi:hypothetical protein